MKKFFVLMLALCMCASAASADIKGKIDDEGRQLVLLWSPRKYNKNSDVKYGQYTYQEFDSASGSGRIVNTSPKNIIRTHKGLVVIMGEGAEDAFGTTAEDVWLDIKSNIPEEIYGCISQVEFICDDIESNLSWHDLKNHPLSVKEANFQHVDHNSRKDNRLIYYNYGGYQFDELADDITRLYVQYSLEKKEKKQLLQEYRETFNDDAKLLDEEDCLIRLLRRKYDY